jgi:hypothetical protein
VTPEEDRVQLLAQARHALGISAADVDDAARRFAARIEADSQRGGWRSSFELAPIFRTWGRVLVLGAIGVGLVALGMSRCPLYEQAIAPPPVADEETG